MSSPVSPRITVITPSFNYGRYLERTIDSVLSQGYENLQYIIIDGGSTDESVSIIRRYEQHLAYWHSAPDRGQAHAINQGLAHSDGELINWINADDTLAQDALHAVAQIYRAEQPDLIAGKVVNRHVDPVVPDEVITSSHLTPLEIIEGSPAATFHQPGTWWRGAILRALKVREDLHYAFDYHLLLRYLARHPSVSYTDAVLAEFLIHDASKTSCHQDRFHHERMASLEALLEDPELRRFHRAIRLRLRRQYWHDQVAAIRADSRQTRMQKRLKLVGASLHDPRIRISRFTAGALRRC